MAGLLYHFPDKTIGDWKHAVQAAPSLADVLDDCSLSTSHGTFPGPGGQGTLCAIGDTVSLRYAKDEQTWLDCGEYWLGWETKAPPGPADLAREKMIAGHWVKLLDGNDWQVPALPMLPCGYDRIGGEIVRKPQAKFADLMAFADRVAEYNAGGGQVTLTEAFVFCGRLLRLNYRIPEGACLMSGLDLMSDREVNAMLFAALDGPNVQKKT